MGEGGSPTAVAFQSRLATHNRGKGLTVMWVVDVGVNVAKGIIHADVNLLGIVR